MTEIGSRGHEIQVPIHCPTIELKDLADVLNFEDRGEVGGTYAFELTEAGLYQRKEIETDVKPRFPKFNQIRDVDVGDYKEEIDYRLRNVKNKWTLVPVVDIDWEVKFEFKSPYTLISKDYTFRKALNSGPLIVSLVPDNESKRRIALKPYKKNRYVAHRKESVTGRVETILDFIPKIDIGNNFTMMFDMILRPSEKSISTRIMEGIQFSWRDIGEKEIRAFVILRKGEEQEDLLAVSNNNSLLLNINKESLTQLEQINLTHLDLISFYYTDKVLTDNEMEILWN